MKQFIKTTILGAAMIGTLSTQTMAGGLADAIVERQPEIIEETTRDAMPAWVLPAVALVLLGAVASGGGGGDDSSSNPPPLIDEVK